MSYVDTSLEAYDSIQPDLPQLRQLVFDVIYGRGEYGATADEIRRSLQIENADSTIASRVTELHQEQRIVRTTTKRPTRSGRNAYVYVAAGSARSRN